MNVEIIEEPIRFHLHGIGGVVENERYGEVGLRLMNEMWRVVKGAGIPNTGINHWVYLPEGRMFVGVELRNRQQASLPDELEPLRRLRRENVPVRIDLGERAAHPPVEKRAGNQPRKECRAPSGLAGGRRQQVSQDAADAGNHACAEPQQRRRQADEHASDGGGHGREMFHGFSLRRDCRQV